MNDDTNASHDAGYRHGSRLWMHLGGNELHENSTNQLVQGYSVEKVIRSFDEPLPIDEVVLTDTNMRYDFGEDSHYEKAPPAESVLRKLTHFDWAGTAPGLQGVKRLDLRGGLALENLDGLSALPHLTELILSDCPALKRPSALCKLKSVTKLTLWDMKGTNLDLSALKGMPSLRHLSLKNCQLWALGPPDVIANLTHLHVSLDWESRESSLVFAALSNCHQLLEFETDSYNIPLEYLAGNTRLRKLSLPSSFWMTSISGLSRFPQLHSLDLNLHRVTDLLPLNELTELDDLKLKRMSCTNSRVFSKLYHLRKLVLTEPFELREISSLSRMADLRELNIWKGHRIADLSPLQNLQHLQTLKLTDFPSVKSLAGLDKLNSLEKLALEEFPRAGQSRFLSSLSANLNEVRVGQLNDLEWITAHPNLKNLWVYSSPNLTSLTPLLKARQLEEINLMGYHQIKDFSPLVQMTEFGVEKEPGFAPHLRKFALRNFYLKTGPHTDSNSFLPYEISDLIKRQYTMRVHMYHDEHSFEKLLQEDAPTQILPIDEFSSQNNEHAHVSNESLSASSRGKEEQKFHAFGRAAKPVLSQPVSSIEETDAPSNFLEHQKRDGKTFYQRPELPSELVCCVECSRCNQAPIMSLANPFITLFWNCIFWNIGLFLPRCRRCKHLMMHHKIHHGR